MEFKNFLSTISSIDLDDEEMKMVDNLRKLSEPESVGSREEYNELIGSILNEKKARYFDLKDIDNMIDTASEQLPKDIAENLNEDLVKETIEGEALDIADDLHPATLAVGVSEAIYNFTDHRVLPNTLLSGLGGVSTKAVDLATQIGNQYDDEEVVSTGLDSDDSYDDEFEDEEIEVGYED